VGEQPTFAKQIVFETVATYEPQATKSFLIQQFFKNAGEVWASSPHLRSKLFLKRLQLMSRRQLKVF